MNSPRKLLAGSLKMIAAGIVISVAGCVPPGDQPQPRIPGLKSFSSAEELRQFLVQQAQERRGDIHNFSFGSFLWNFLASPTAAPDQEAGGADGRSSYSTTNIQEEGVDESDVVKNDGRYIYWLRERNIHIVNALPPEAMTVAATVELEMPGDSLYLQGDLLVAISTARIWDIYPLDGPISMAAERVRDSSSGEPVNLIGGPWNDGGQVTVTIFDVSDPANPVKLYTIDLEGQLVSSRLIGTKLHLVLTSMPRLPEEVSPRALQRMSLGDWLPDYRITPAAGAAVSGDMTAWNDVWGPIVGDGYAMTTLLTMDIRDPLTWFRSKALTANAGTIYASLEALYITDTRYGWENSRSFSRTDTMIHKLRFTNEGGEYAGTGLVPGRPLNQYALGEYQGYLRIATTSDTLTGWQAATSNAVYVLGENPGRKSLDIIGKVENIAPDETIYAARFIGPRGFLVTFKRIDPLFTLDLSDPANPRVAGELKVPGYSDHIQLLDENHLLTIGKDAEDAGQWAWVRGVQLSIFDVSDLSNPQLKHKRLIGGRGTHSEANHNPKAFTHYPARNALAFPIEIYSDLGSGPVWGEHEFSGLIVFRVDADTGFTELGRIPYFTRDRDSRGCYWSYYGSSRGVFIDDTVYAVSDLGVTSAGLDDPSTVLGRVRFSDESGYRYCSWVQPSILPPDAGDLR